MKALAGLSKRPQAARKGRLLWQTAGATYFLAAVLAFPLDAYWLSARIQPPRGIGLNKGPKDIGPRDIEPRVLREITKISLHST